MEHIKINFYNEDEKDSILEKYSDFELVHLVYTGGRAGYVEFKNKENIFSVISLNKNKISILEGENEKLKQELALTQDAVNEMLFMMMNMEVK